ncbi:MAG TPA: glucosamine-6-phosphate deaminase [Bacteroidales bacterium]|nr:glucosamine-6-phosphate deaminase [Bacteroidales bacterium]
MEIVISENKQALGILAAEKGAELIRKAIALQGKATIILATGASQFEMLAELVKKDINWSLVTVFHLDEYIGIPESHPASFRRYLKERFADIVQPGKFIYINGEAEPEEECERLGKLISGEVVDVAFVGIGENGHLAFNDPLADFETRRPYLVVSLDENCRRQQLGEGWFPTLKDVPEKAISMSIHQIMKSKAIICTVPDQRKAEAVKNTVEGPVTPAIPASVLRQHKQVWLFLDKNSAMLLS